MENRSTRIDILQQLFITATPEQKRAFLSWAKSLSKSNAASKDSGKSEKAVCPFCGSVHIRRNGHRNGCQRFVCVECRRTFGLTTETILHKSKKPLAVWSLYVNCMMERMPLRRTAKICGINLATAFVWRHKILDALTNMMDEVTLKGVVEADETYQLVSFKGNHRKSKTFKMP